MQLLIENRADINVVSEYGSTALGKAREYGKKNANNYEKDKFPKKSVQTVKK